MLAGCEDTFSLHKLQQVFGLAGLGKMLLRKHAISTTKP